MSELRHDDPADTVVKEITNVRPGGGRVRRSYHDELGKSVAADVEAIGFFSSILAGLVLGLGLDAWWGTRPALTVIGIVAGSVSGFWKLWLVARRETERENADAG